MSGSVYLLLTVGGMAGAVSRLMVSRWLAKRFPSIFPYGTLTVNLIGSLLIGLLFGMAEWHMGEPVLYAVVGTGFCGAFTTYSTFAFEAVKLLRSKQYGIFVCYISVSCLAGIMFAYFGYVIALRYIV